MKSADNKEARWKEAYPRTLKPSISVARFVSVWLVMIWICYAIWAFALSFT